MNENAACIACTSFYMVCCLVTCVVFIRQRAGWLLGV